MKPYAECPVCHTDRPLRKDGTLAAHRDTCNYAPRFPARYPTCAGTGKNPDGSDPKDNLRHTLDRIAERPATPTPAPPADVVVDIQLAPGEVALIGRALEAFALKTRAQVFEAMNANIPPDCREDIDLLRKDARAADTLRSDLPARKSPTTQKLTALLEECKGILQLCLTTPVLLQPEVRAVKALGAQMGYGTIMSTAAGVWRESLKDRGIEGGAFTVGPCGDTVKAIIEKIDNMLAPEEPPCPRDCQHLAQDQSGWWCRHYNTSDGIWADPAENCYTPPPASGTSNAEEPTQS